MLVVLLLQDLLLVLLGLLLVRCSRQLTRVWRQQFRAQQHQKLKTWRAAAAPCNPVRYTAQHRRQVRMLVVSLLLPATALNPAAVLVVVAPPSQVRQAAAILLRLPPLNPPSNQRLQMKL